MWIVVVLYISGALITAGLIGGIRDEMDGIGDMFKIFFWPAALVFWLIYRIGAAIVQIGVMLRRNT